MTQVHFYDQTCVHVDGYRQIVSFDTTQVLLRCKKNMLVIEGNALRIASFDGAEITVRGDSAMEGGGGREACVNGRIFVHTAVSFI